MSRNINLIRFEDCRFEDAVLVVEESLTSILPFGCVTNEEKEALSLHTLKQILINTENHKGLRLGNYESSHFLEDWMLPYQHAILHLNFEVFSHQNASIDVWLEILSKYRCEAEFMSLLIEEEDGEIINYLVAEVLKSLKRWENTEKSGKFIVRGLEFLLGAFKYVSISFEVVGTTQRQLFNVLEDVLTKTSCKNTMLLLFEIMNIYFTEFAKCFLVIKETRNKDLHDNLQQMIHSAFENIISKESNLVKADGLSHEFPVKLKKILIEKLHQVSENKDSQKVKEVLLNKNMPDSKSLDCWKIIDVLCYGSEEISKIHGIVCKSLNMSEMEINATFPSDDWLSVVEMIKKLKDSAKKEDVILSSSMKISQEWEAQSFLELLDGWEISALSCLQQYPDLASLYNPLIVTEKFLIGWFKYLQGYRLHSATDVERKQKLDKLSKISCEMIKGIDVKVAQKVMIACADIFQNESYNLLNGEFTYQKFKSQLNFGINKLSFDKSEDVFDHLSQLTLIHPYKVLYELVIRGVTSTPMAVVILQFLKELSALLLLKKNENHTNHVICILQQFSKELKKDNFETVCIFIDGLLRIKYEESSNLERNFISPLDIINDIMLPELEKHRGGLISGVSLHLIMQIMQTTINFVASYKALDNYNGLVRGFLQCVFDAIKIKETFEHVADNDLEALFQLANRTEQLHLTIILTLKQLKPLLFNNQECLGMITSELPGFCWLSQFYFADVFLNGKTEVSLSLPHSLLYFSDSFMNLNFEEEIAASVESSSNNTWPMIMKLCQINTDASYHFLHKLICHEKPITMKILTALAVTMIESTKSGWQSSLDLLDKYVEAQEEYLLIDLGLEELSGMARLIRQLACKVSLISHAFFIINRKFGELNEVIVADVTQILHIAFVSEVIKMQTMGTKDSVMGLAVLYNSLSKVCGKLSPFFAKCFSGLMLQILETINQKLVSESVESEVVFWKNKLEHLKQFLTN